MKKHLFSLALAAVTLFSAFSAKAQLLTADTTGFGTVWQPMSADTLYTQSFSGITDIDTFTLRFWSANNTATNAIPLNVYFTEWSTGTAQATSVLAAGTIVLPFQATWSSGFGAYYYDVAMDFSSVATGLSAANTYAFSVLGTALTASNDVRIPYASNAYALGVGYETAGASGGPLGAGSGSALPGASADWQFIADSSVASFTPFAAPVPEASTVAVLFAGVFVAGLVTLRLRQKRQRAATAATA